MNLSVTPKWWFPRKDFGWGWGLPSAWQGWIVLLVFLFLMCVGGPLAVSALGKFRALMVMAGLTIAFIVIVVVKGEPLTRESDSGQGLTRNPAMRLRYYKASSCFISVLLILLSVPLVLKWVPKNAIYGFRVADSLMGTNAHWFYVNQVAGMAGISAGVLSILFALLIADRLGISEVAKGRAAIIVTLVLTLASAFSPYLVR